MGFTHAHGLILVLIAASMLGGSMGSKDWGHSSNYTGWGWGWGSGWGSQNNQTLNQTEGPNKIIVGGSENWHYGFNYSEWAFQNAPFYFNDTLVFKYDPPSNNTFPHSVYLFHDFWSYLNCDLKRAKMIASPTQGGGDGFEFVLKRWRSHYFACGERNGVHCKAGGMRFMVVPLLRWHN
ncbi:Phytocyanin domain - like 10 [Theobroma cacao]|nr:Phytocyanin domain - like 10 [Theobroma cacao]